LADGKQGRELREVKAGFGGEKNRVEVVEETALLIRCCVEVSVNKPPHTWC
jgi:hypothetical protein